MSRPVKTKANLEGAKVKPSVLLETIRETLNDTFIEDGTIRSFDRVCLSLESNIKNKVKL
jgi:hypothetical protein